MAEARMVRAGILTSDAVNKLGWAAEVFYRRLMSIVDDFGRYDARPDILRGLLYPLKLDNVSKSDIVKWLDDCSDAGLIRLYSTDGRGYLEILNFGQRLRSKKSKFPEPQTIDGNMQQSAANGRNWPPELELEEELELELEEEEELQDPAGAGGDLSEKNTSSKNSGKPGKRKKVPPKKEKDPLPEVKLPFGDSFRDAWLQWKQYKKLEFGFKYKSPQSEQAALNELIRLAKGVEQTALTIIQRSMAKGWKGFFELKNESTNGKPFSKGSPTGGDVSTGSILSKIASMPD